MCSSAGLIMFTSASSQTTGNAFLWGIVKCIPWVDLQLPDCTGTCRTEHSL
jgi:hypothetical protein